MQPSYKAIQAEINKTQYPKKEFKFRAYKDGECFEFDNDTNAYNYSKLVEKFQVNVEQYTAQLEQYQNEMQAVYDKWYAELREYFSEYTDEVFAIIFEYGCEKDYAGYDEVTSYMLSFAYYVDKLLRVSK